MKKLLALLLTVIMILGLMVGCNGTPENTVPSDAETEGTQSTEATEPTLANAERYGGHLDVSLAAKVNNVDPAKQTNVWRYMWATCVWENALTRDADNNIQPGVCDYELSDDQLTLKLWVREGKVFHNGDPVTIEDVKATLDRACGGLFASGVNYVAKYLESSTIEGDVLTLKFTEYNEKTMYYLASYQTWFGILPQEVCEKWGQEIITDINDAIGTGPYKVTDWVTDVSVDLERFDDYVIMDEGKSAYAGPKYAYMDSISFYSYTEISSAVVATLAGQYDVVEDIEDEMKPIAEAVNVVESQFDSNTAMSLIFNTYGTSNVCSKYPSLRKAIAAAFDFEEYAAVRHGEGGFVSNGNFVLGETFATDVFDNADYFGKQNLEAAAKYVEAAKAEGWDGVEPVLLVFNSSSSYDATLIPKYLEDAGIPCEMQTVESTAASEILTNPEGGWDLKISFPGMTFTPTATTVDFLNTYYNSPEKDAILAQMNSVVLGSEEYMALWEDLANQMVEDCAAVNMGFLVWSWHHNGELNVNDEGVSRYWFNAYWNDPENHPD